MRAFITSPTGMVSFAAAGLIALYLLTTYSTYLILLAPFAMLLVCPLMMLLMMRGHNHGAHGDHGTSGTHAGCHSMARTDGRESAPERDAVQMEGGANGHVGD